MGTYDCLKCGETVIDGFESQRKLTGDTLPDLLVLTHPLLLLETDHFVLERISIQKD